VNLPIVIRRSLPYSKGGYIVVSLSPLWRPDIAGVLTTLQIMLETRVGRRA
jgi:hypothetical protein